MTVEKKPKQITIIIDHKEYKTEEKRMSGLEIRALANPPISQDRDLFLVINHDKPDEKINDEQVVQLKNGMHFYSAPRTINPGDYASR
ncbi:MAG: multiubiquitin domain-containing protein [Candidatus Magasanikbacteria bacterium]|jgi:hypothetical protein